MSYERLCLFPIKCHGIWNLYLEQKNRFWTPEEIDYSKDRDSWDTMNSEEKSYIATTLAFFANSDNMVIDNLFSVLLKQITFPEARLYFSAQAFFESIHVQTYNLLIDTLVEDEQAKVDLFRAAVNDSKIKPKLAWCNNWIENSEASITEILIAWCAVEGIFFSSSFASIFWLRKQGKLPGVCFANEKIVEDEAIHVRASVELFNIYKKDHPVPTQRIYEIIDEAVKLEQQFVSEALPTRLKGMNKTTMCCYVEIVADTILQMLGLAKKYKKQNPFPWMDGLGFIGKSNFFEKRVSEYQRNDNDSMQTHIMLGDDL